MYINPLIFTLTLPYPCSANAYWESFVPRGMTRAIVHLSTKAKKYKKLVAQLALEQGVRQALAGPVEVTLELYPHLPQDFAKRARIEPLWWDLSVQCIDLDNANKVLWDALKGIAFTDDKMIRKCVGEIMVPDGEARVVVTIKTYERVCVQEGLFVSAPVYVPKRKYVEPVPAHASGDPF